MTILRAAEWRRVGSFFPVDSGEEAVVFSTLFIRVFDLRFM
jgi:hypothetical protein